MLLTIIWHGQNATDLSWLLHKRPDRFQFFNLGYGTAFVFFPEYREDRSEACLLLKINSEGLNELCKAKDGGFQYVNPHKYLSSSLLCSAIAKAYSTALKGICVEKQDAADIPHDFEVQITNFSCRIKIDFIERIFLPLGYEISWTDIAAESASKNDFAYGNLRLRGNVTLKNLLSHLYILIPGFEKHIHYWLGENQVDKFIRHSQNWLESHPEKNFIIREYFLPAADLKHRLLEYFDSLNTKGDISELPKLNKLRQEAIADVLAHNGAKNVIDLGCGDGSLLSFLFEQNRYEKIAGMDVSAINIEFARKRLAKTGHESSVFVGSLTYKDNRLSGYDAAVLAEVIEHFEPERVESVMRNILKEISPRLLIITTPNKTYNDNYLNLEPGGMRHPDHRHEFDASEFVAFCQKYAAAYGYKFELSHIGVKLADYGSPTLMGILKKCA